MIGAEERIESGALGALIGWTMGTARIGRAPSPTLRFFDPVPLRMAPSSALDAWILAARAVRTEVPAPLIGPQYFNSWHYHSGAAGFGLANLERGVPPPLCGSLDNPCSLDSSAFGRAVFWGLAFTDSDKALEYAFWDASFDHARDGAWCAAAVSWLISKAGLGSDPKAVVLSLLDVVPAESSFRGAFDQVIKWFGQPDGPLHVRNAVRSLDLTPAALALVEICSAFGQSTRFGAGLGHVVTGDAPRDTVGLVLGALEGVQFGAVPADWSSPLGSDYVVGHGLLNVESPQTIGDFVQMVVGAWTTANPQRSAVAEATEEVKVEASLEPDATTTEPGAAENVEANPAAKELPEETNTTEAAVEIVPEAVIEPVATPNQPRLEEPTIVLPNLVPGFEIRALLAGTGKTCHAVLSDLELRVAFVDRVKVSPGQQLGLDLRIIATQGEEVPVHASVEGPAGWSTASRLTDFRAVPDRETSFPTLLQAHEAWTRHPETLSVTLNDTSVAIPIIPSDDWAWTGPFANPAGSGFDTFYSPEKLQEPGQTFGTRSGHPAHWLPWNRQDFDEFLVGQPGVLYLATDLEFPRACHATVVAGARGAIKLWMDGKIVISCQDSRGVDIEKPGPFEGTCSVGVLARCLIKLVRGSAALGPLVLAFRDEEGRVMYPIARQSLSSRILSSKG